VWPSVMAILADLQPEDYEKCGNEIVDWVIEQEKFSVNRLGRLGHPPLWTAASSGLFNYAKKLITAGANVAWEEVSSVRGNENLLAECVRNLASSTDRPVIPGSFEFLDWLITTYPDHFNVTKKQGNDPLSFCVNNVVMLHYLVKKGMDPNAKGNYKDRTRYEYMDNEKAKGDLRETYFPLYEAFKEYAIPGYKTPKPGAPVEKGSTTTTTTTSSGSTSSAAPASPSPPPLISAADVKFPLKTKKSITKCMEKAQEIAKKASQLIGKEVTVIDSSADIFVKVQPNTTGSWPEGKILELGDYILRYYNQFDEALTKFCKNADNKEALADVWTAGKFGVRIREGYNKYWCVDGGVLWMEVPLNDFGGSIGFYDNEALEAIL